MRPSLRSAPLVVAIIAAALAPQALAAASSQTKVHVMGYSATLPNAVAQSTPGVLAVLTPDGLVWSSYAGAKPLGKTYAPTAPFAVYLSASGGSGPLRPGRTLAKLPYRQLGKFADLTFLGGTENWLGFAYELPSSTAILTAGMLNLRTGAVRMAPASLTKGARSVIAAGGELGIVEAHGQVATFAPASGKVASYAPSASRWLASDLAYGLGVGTVPSQLGHAGTGVATYAMGSASSFYAPSGWTPFLRSLPGGMQEFGYRDPSDPNARVEIVANPCVTCFMIGSSRGSMPAPLPLLPETQGKAHLLTRWVTDVEITFEGTAVGYKYPVWGEATAGSPSAPGDSTILVTLPPSDSALAQAILQSYPLTQ